MHRGNSNLNDLREIIIGLQFSLTCMIGVVECDFPDYLQRLFVWPA